MKGGKNTEWSVNFHIMTVYFVVLFSIGSVFGDVTFNVGGPVWAMDWCPIPGTFGDVALHFILTVYEPFSLSSTASCHGLGEIIDFTFS